MGPTLDHDSSDKKLSDNKEEKQTPQNIDSESKQEKVEIESIGEILDINESEDQTKAPVSDSFINETNTSLEKQNSSHIDEELSVEKEETGDTAPDSFINDIYTS